MFHGSGGIRQLMTSGADPWASLDGRLNAPAGSAQFPTILNTYHPVGVANGRYRWPSMSAFNSSTGNFQQAQWEVVGVDYAVGIPSGMSLADPWPGFPTQTNAALAPSLRGSANTGGLFGNSSYITINDSNFTVSGFDFSLHGGITLNINTGVNNTTVQYCKFKTGSNNASATNAITATAQSTDTPQNGLTVQYCDMDGSGDTISAQTAGQGLLELDCVGTILIQYNYIHNAFAEHIVYGQNVAVPPHPVDITIQYNVLYDDAVGVQYPSSGVHGDWFTVQSNTSNAPVNSISINWNLWIQDNWATNGINPENGNLITTFNVLNNTMLAIDGSFQGGPLGEFVGLDITNNNDGGISGVLTCSNNFMDPTGLFFGLDTAFSFTSNANAGGHSAGSGNVNMTNGSTIAVPPFG